MTRSNRSCRPTLLHVALAAAGCAHPGTPTTAGAPSAPVAAKAVDAPAPTGQAAVLIHRPAAEVFEAIVDPAITSKVWFEHGSGRLAPGTQVRWDFPGGVHADVAVRELEPNRRVVMEWWSEGERPTTVRWVLTPKGDGSTWLGVIHSGFVGDAATVAARADDSTRGFSLVLTGLKAYLEHDVQLDLVRDAIACAKDPRTRADNPTPVGHACLLIRKPAAEVFEALVDPAITTKFWFVAGSGRLEPGGEVRWEFPGNVAARVAVRAFEPGRRLALEWSTPGQRPTALEWRLVPVGETATLLSVTHSGFVGTPAAVADQANYSTGGFTFVISWLKAYLEHGLRPNAADYFERVADISG